MGRVRAAVRRRNSLHSDIARLSKQTASVAIEPTAADPTNRRAKATGCADSNKIIEKSRKIEFIPDHDRLKSQILRRPDDGLDRQSLPGAASLPDQTGAALHRDGDGGGGAARRSRAAA